MANKIKKLIKEKGKFDCNEIRKNAERFSKEMFKREFKEFVEKKVKFLTMQTSI